MVNSEPLQILVVTDHRLVQDVLIDFMQTHSRFLLAGSHETAEEAASHLSLWKPAIIILHARLTESPAGRSVQLLKEAQGGSGSIVVYSTESASDEGELLLAVLRAGARGFVGRGDRLAELARCLEDVAAGGYWISPTAVPRLAAEYVELAGGRTTARDDFGLTGREGEVLELVAEGMTNSAIAETLRLSSHTVARHLQNIMFKLKVPNRTAAVLAAQQLGILSGPLRQPAYLTREATVSE